MRLQLGKKRENKLFIQKQKNVTYVIERGNGKKNKLTDEKEKEIVNKNIKQ